MTIFSESGLLQIRRDIQLDLSIIIATQMMAYGILVFVSHDFSSCQYYEPRTIQQVFFALLLLHTTCDFAQNMLENDPHSCFLGEILG